MGAFHGAAAGGDGRRGDARRGEVMQEPAAAHDIGHGVERADLVEVDVLHRRAVRLGLGGGEEIIDRERIRFHRIVQLQRGNQRADVVQIVMVVVMVLQRLVGLLLFPVDEDGKVRTQNAALLARLEGERDAGDADRVQFSNHRRPIRAELQKGRAEHIARGAHG